VALNRRRKRAIAGGLREGVFSLCALAGVLLGFLWDVHHRLGRPAHANVACHAHAHSQAAVRELGHCFSGELSAVTLGWIAPIAIGAGLGTLVGLVLALGIRFGHQTRPAKGRRAA